MKNGYPEKTLGDWTCMCFGCELGTMAAMAVFFLVVGKQNMMIRSRICQGNGWLVYSFWWPGHGDVFSASSPHIVSTKSDDLNPLRSRIFSENQFHINFLLISSSQKHMHHALSHEMDTPASWDSPVNLEIVSYPKKKGRSLMSHRSKREGSGA